MGILKIALGWIMGRSLLIQLAMLAGLVFTVWGSWKLVTASYYKAGYKAMEKVTDGAIDQVGKENRAKKEMLDAQTAGRDEQLGAKIRRFRETGTRERDWIATQEKPDGRIDPQTVNMLEK